MGYITATIYCCVFEHERCYVRIKIRDHDVTAGS